MQRESLTRVKTMRDIATGLGLARVQKKPLCTNTLDRATPLEPKPDNDKVVAIALEQERRRFQRKSVAFERFADKVKKIRQKLANTKEKNRRLMELRFALHEEYWDKTNPNPQKNGEKRQESRFSNSVKIRY